MTTPRLAARLAAPMFPGFKALQCRRFLAGKEELCLRSHRALRRSKGPGFTAWMVNYCRSCGLPFYYRRLGFDLHRAGRSVILFCGTCR